jgi:3-oxoacyl-[acyl-carrier-protein] synthase-1
MKVRDSLYAGKSGIIHDPVRKEFGYRSGLTGFVERPNLKTSLIAVPGLCCPNRANTPTWPRWKRLSKPASMPILLNTMKWHIYGNDSTAKPVIDAIGYHPCKKRYMLVGSGSVFQTMNSTVNMNLSTIFKLRGINFTVSAACASGSHAIGLGFHLIRTGLQDVNPSAGEPRKSTSIPWENFDALSAFSVRESEPHRASRPFDRDRDGLIPSGGAATVIVESLESALRRGAPSWEKS